MRRGVDELIGFQGTQVSSVDMGMGTGSSAAYTWTRELSSITVSFLANRAAVSALVDFNGTRPAGPAATLAAYGRLQDGMSYEQAARIMGGPGTYGGFTAIANMVSERVIWHGDTPGASAVVTFRDGRVVSRLQIGLR